MSRREYLALGDNLSERDENYLTKCEDEDNWARCVPGMQHSFYRMYACGMITSELCAAQIAALTESE